MRLDREQTVAGYLVERNDGRRRQSAEKRGTLCVPGAVQWKAKARGGTLAFVPCVIQNGSVDVTVFRGSFLERRAEAVLCQLTREKLKKVPCWVVVWRKPPGATCAVTSRVSFSVPKVERGKRVHACSVPLEGKGKGRF